MLQALTDARAITIDRGPQKKPRPLQIGDVLLRIILGESVQYHKSEIVAALGQDQMGVGVRAGVEAIVHAIDETLENKGATLSVDLNNAYGEMNTFVGIINARTLPSLAT